MVGKNESSFWLTFWLTSQHKANTLVYANGLYLFMAILQAFPR